jgi:L-ribulokinase
MSDYVLGFDYGTNSCRMVCVDSADGTILFQCVKEYPSGVIEGVFPITGKALPNTWALQDPDDYLTVQRDLVRSLLDETGVAPGQIRAIGLDFTNCTMMPVNKNGDVLCQDPRFRGDPHSWVKLWKHHAAEKYARKIYQLARDRKEPWLKRYGNMVSAEWLFPKILQIFYEDRSIYDAADTFIEAVDWVVNRMTKGFSRSSATLGVNAFWSPDDGFPDNAFFSALDSELGATIGAKLGGAVLPVGSPAGHLSREFAAYIGLEENTVVSIGHGDSEVTACGLGITEPYKMIMVMGTSLCYQYMNPKFEPFPGLSAVVRDGMIPGYYAYEAGQSAVGDIYDWFIQTCMPDKYFEEAKEKNISIYQLMNEKAADIPAGETGLLALDWFNGSRSLLMNYDLTGMILGLTIRTKPEEIYKALMESTAFGARRIIEAFTDNGLKIDEMIATGGLALKAPYVVQTFADIIGKSICVPSSSDAGALGSAVCAAVALDSVERGVMDFAETAKRLVKQKINIYRPAVSSRGIYDNLYSIYKTLYSSMGEVSDSAMQRLRETQQITIGKSGIIH